MQRKESPTKKYMKLKPPISLASEGGPLSLELAAYS
jgi:hypothetical protein